MQIVFEDIPQQNISDCGIFCIEFMRAFITCNGCKAAKDLKNHVQQTSLGAARKHVVRELKKKEFLQKNADTEIQI
jgi:Ulp1 family protease